MNTSPVVFVLLRKTEPGRKIELFILVLNEVAFDELIALGVPSVTVNLVISDSPIRVHNSSFNNSSF